MRDSYMTNEQKNQIKWYVKTLIREGYSMAETARMVELQGFSKSTGRKYYKVFKNEKFNK